MAPSGAARRVVLATHNPHKVAEIQQIVARTLPDVQIVAYDGPEPVEDGVTFAENALIKARAAAAHTGLPAIADDSGICVQVLGGSPGVFSAYWAGQQKDAVANRDLLLDQLRDIADPHRAAEFVTVIALVVPDAAAAPDAPQTSAPAVEHTVQGVWPGRLAHEASGVGGFGYDPVFIPDGQPDGEERTVGEWSDAEKQSQSHRARAFEALLPLLATL